MATPTAAGTSYLQMAKNVFYAATGLEKPTTWFKFDAGGILYDHTAKSIAGIHFEKIAGQVDESITLNGTKVLFDTHFTCDGLKEIRVDDGDTNRTVKITIIHTKEVLEIWTVDLSKWTHGPSESAYQASRLK